MAVAALTLGSIAVAATLADSLKTAFPARAHVLVPWNGRITALLSEKTLESELTVHGPVSAAVYARDALLYDPTAVSAIATLGFEAELSGRSGQADRLFAYASFLSRRHLPTELWLIERAVSRGDVRGALHHYDTALRTSTAAPGVLYPVLAQALTEQPIRTGLIDTLARRPLWGDGFIAYLAANGADAPSLADLFLRLRRRGVAISAEADATAVSKLLDAGAPDAAWQYYASIRHGVTRDRSRDSRFTANLATASVFDWRVTSDPALVASIQRAGDGGLFDFAAPTSSSGVLVQQTQILAAGRYRLAGHSIGIDQPPQSRPYWTLTCQDRRELGRVDVPNSSQAAGMFAGDFEVPMSSCPVQVLTLVARASDELQGVTGQIDRVQLSRIE